MSVLKLSGTTLSAVFVEILGYYEFVLEPKFQFIYVGALGLTIIMWVVFSMFRGKLDRRREGNDEGVAGESSNHGAVGNSETIGLLEPYEF